MTIGSLNCRGLNRFEKRKRIKFYMKEKNKDIFFLQETHCAPDNVTIFQNQISKNSIWSPGSNNSRGCAIIFKRKNIEVTKKEVDPQGRYILANIKVENEECLLANIYAPNTDCPEFFITLFEKIDKMEMATVIIGGDFNLVLNTDKDRKKSTQNNDKASQVVKAFMNDNDFCDVWRTQHEEDIQYTWRKTMYNKSYASRIDMFMSHISTLDWIEDSTIEAGCDTDHSLITITINKPGQKRGPGIWRMNTQILTNQEFLLQAKSLIKKTIDESTDIMTGWEYMKYKIAELARDMGKGKTSEKRLLLENLYKLKNIYEQEYLTDDDCSSKIKDNYAEVSNKIIELEQEETSAIIFRSRAKWAQEGERSTKYFLSLEKRNYLAKTAYSIFIKDGTLCTDQLKILQEQRLFYQELYTENRNIVFNLENNTNIKLNEEDKTALDQKITMDEIYDVTMSFKEGKAPGNDGIPVEFYKVMWGDLKETLYSLFQKILQIGELNTSARRGLINLIPKKDKDTRFVKNMRPLTLLNTDYKILAGILAARLKSVLPRIIGDQQTGFMEGRDIQTNMRKTIDIITHANAHKDVKLIIINIDFIKCFDLVSHNSIYKTLEFFNFGPLYTKWVKIFFHNFAVCTQNNGHTSSFFAKTRGINQGCPISPFLFLCCAEIMAILIKNNSKIKGAKIADVEHVISQFADDSSLFLEYSEECLNAAIQTLQVIEEQIGLTISYEKTCVYRVGSLQYSEAKLYTSKNLAWSDNDLEMLGITITNGPQQNNKSFDPTIKKFKATADTWMNRQLSITGKVLVINSLLASLFTYKMSTLPQMSTQQVSKLHEIINKLLWKGGKIKIPLHVLQRKKQHGGLGLVNFTVKHEALHIQWVKKVCECDFMRSYVFNWTLPGVDDFMWQCNISSEDAQKLITKNSFWKDVVISWARYHYYIPSDVESIRSQIIWYNSHIRIDGKVLIPNGEYIKKGVFRLHHLMRDGSLMSRESLELEYGIQISWLWYNQLRAAIPGAWKRTLSTYERNCVNESLMESISDYSGDGPGRDDPDKEAGLSLEIMLDTKKVCKYVYDNALKQNYNSDFFKKYGYSFFAKLQMTHKTQEEYYKLFRNIAKLSKITQFRDFQYRLLLGNIHTNNRLYRWGLVESNICELCEICIQTPIHLLAECEIVQPIWRWIEYLCNVTLSNYKIISNEVVPNSAKAENAIVLYAKRYIFNSKCRRIHISVKGLQNYLIQWINVEKYNAKSSLSIEKFEKKWKHILDTDWRRQ